MAASRKVLSVVGPHSGCGKTLFVTHLVQSRPGLGCLKISPVCGADEPLPGRGNEGDRDFYFEPRAKLETPGKDTARYLGAGAGCVERLRHRAGGLAAGLREALTHFPPCMPVVVESSSAVPLLDPVAVILIVRPPLREMKPATQGILPLVTDLFVNTSESVPGRENEVIRLHAEFATLSPKHTWSADLSRTPPPHEMLERLRRLLFEGRAGG